MSNRLPLVVTLLLIAGILYLLNNWWAVGRRADEFAREVRTSILDEITDRVDIDQVREQIIQLALDWDIHIDRDELEITMGPPALMNDDTLAEVQRNRMNVAKVIHVRLAIELGEGYTRRVFHLQVQRPFEEGKVPRVVNEPKPPLLLP